MRGRQVPEPAVDDAGAAGELRLGERPLDLSEQRGGAAAPHVSEEALEDAEVGFAGRFDRDDGGVEVNLTAHLELGAVAGDPQPADVEHVPVQRQLDRPVVGQGVVEQLEAELFDGRAHGQPIDVGELAIDAHRAARDRGRERRQPRLEEAQIRIQRRILEPHRHLGSHRGRELEAAGSGDEQAGRGRFEIRTDVSPRSESRPETWPTPSSPANRSSTRTLTS